MKFIDLLQAEAKRLGFVFCGITTPDTPDHFHVYLDWIDRGYHASMTYLSSESAIEARMSPDSLMPGCKSIIVLGYPYHIVHSTAGQVREEQHIPLGRISSYACNTDYHQTIPPLLESLAIWIKTKSHQPVIWRGFTDSGAILERDLAYRAGVGWIGKNSCLISRESGSYIFLAELLTDITLEHEAFVSPDYCGSCRRCIENCPTGCIQPDRTIDANRCISYLTIENKRAIPAYLREKLSDMVFGCDICQSVCPWNIRLEKSSHARSDIVSDSSCRVDLHKELGLSDENFRTIYNNTPVMRAKRSGYLRNVAVALGNLKYPSSIPVLMHAFEQENDALIRAHIAWALGRYKTDETISFLKKAYFIEDDTDVKAEILSALVK